MLALGEESELSALDFGGLANACRANEGRALSVAFAEPG